MILWDKKRLIIVQVHLRAMGVPNYLLDDVPHPLRVKIILANQVDKNNTFPLQAAKNIEYFKITYLKIFSGIFK